MERAVGSTAEFACRVGYLGDISVTLDAAVAPIVQPATIKIFLERKERDSTSPPQLSERKGIGKITFGLFKPLSFPGRVIPYHHDPDMTAPLRRLWDQHADAPAAWLSALFPQLRPEFLVFASIEIDPAVGGNRLALAVMADLINRHLPPGGIAVLNPYPLPYLLVDDPRSHVSPEQKQRGVAALKRHYARIGLQAIESEPDLMVLQRPTQPIEWRRRDIGIPRERFRAMPDVATYAGLY